MYQAEQEARARVSLDVAWGQGSSPRLPYARGGELRWGFPKAPGGLPDAGAGFSSSSVCPAQTCPTASCPKKVGRAFPPQSPQSPQSPLRQPVRQAPAVALPLLVLAEPVNGSPQ